MKQDDEDIKFLLKKWPRKKMFASPSPIGPVHLYNLLMLESINEKLSRLIDILSEEENNREAPNARSNGSESQRRVVRNGV